MGADLPGVLAAWMVVDVMTDAVIDRWWRPDSEDAQAMPDEWAHAREMAFRGTRDDMVVIAAEMEKRGWLSLDWDAEPPEPRILRAADVLASDESFGSPDVQSEQEGHRG